MTDGTPAPRQNADSGFALLIVLWALVLLTLLGSTITVAGRAETTIAGNIQAQAQAQAAADGAVFAAVFHLLDHSNQTWLANGATHAINIGNAQVAVTVTNEAGKIDPNQAPPGLIAALLSIEGVDTPTAHRVADAIVDLRSVADAGPAPNDRTKNRPYAPPHESFESLGELALVADVTPDLFTLLAPHMDPFLNATPDPAAADKQVAAALAVLAKQGQALATAVTNDGQATVLVIANARLPHSVFTRSCLLRIDPSAVRPWLILSWSDITQASPPAGPAQAKRT
jgi:general secretion pathway protein K